MVKPVAKTSRKTEDKVQGVAGCRRCEIDLMFLMCLLNMERLGTRVWRVGELTVGLDTERWVDISCEWELFLRLPF